MCGLKEDKGNVCQHSFSPKTNGNEKVGLFPHQQLFLPHLPN